jgi:thiamine pyrophosphate-dependent acetolactate synthase large subunit-like protein
VTPAPTARTGGQILVDQLVAQGVERLYCVPGLVETASVADAPRAEAAAIWPGQTQMAELQKMLWTAERPIAIVGGSGWTQTASASVLRFAERFDLPVAAQFRRASVLDGEHPNYGTIRLHQEREYPGRVLAAALRNPDFAAYARAFGGHGETVEQTEEFEPAFARALASGLPAIVHVKVDPEAITPSTTLTAIRETALKRSYAP